MARPLGSLVCLVIALSVVHKGDTTESPTPPAGESTAAPTDPPIIPTTIDPPTTTVTDPTTTVTDPPTTVTEPPTTTVDPGTVNPGAVTTENVTTTEIGVRWTGAREQNTTYVVSWTPANDDGKNNHSTARTKKYTIKKLTPGALYQIDVTGTYLSTSSSSQITQATRPEPVENIGFSYIESEKLRVEWTNRGSRVTGFRVSATSSEKPSKNGTSCNVPTSVPTPGPVLPSQHHRDMCDLFPGALYDFTVIAVSHSQNSDPANKEQRTRPTEPETCTVTSFEENTISISVSLSEGKSLRDRYLVNTTSEDDQETVPQKSERANDTTTITVANCTAGTYYTLDTYAAKDDMISSQSCDITRAQTLLGKASGLEVKSATSDSFDVSWTKAPGRKDTHKVDCVTFTALCRNGTCSGSDDEAESCNCTGLWPGCLYTVTITTQREGFTDRPSDISVRNVTVPKQPDNLTLTRNTLTTLEVNWTSPVDSEYTNFIVSDGTKETTEDRHTTSKEISGLDANKEYDVSVRSRANYSGLYQDSSSTSKTFWTLPNKPKSLDFLEILSRSLNISWSPATTSHVQGYILTVKDSNTCLQRIKFNITSGSFRHILDEFSCRDESEVTIANTATVMYNITGLVPYTSHTLQVVTVNPGGASAYTENSTTTDEDIPGIINRTEVETVTSPQVIALDWKMPLEPNGVILYYTVNWTWLRNGTENSTTSPNETYTITGLIPNEWYNITIAAWTSKGQGPFFDPIALPTKVGVPQAVSDIVRTPGHQKVDVSWNLAHYPGPTNYTVTVTDIEDADNNSPYMGYSHGFDKRQVEVKGLGIYWDYDLKVEAYTTAGNSSNDGKRFRTLPSKPGNVTDVTSNKTEPENQHYPEHCRKMSVSWTVPTKRNQHGHIKYFTVTYTDQQGSSKQHTETANCNDEHYCSENDRYTTVIMVQAEKNYTAKVTTHTDTEPGDPVESTSGLVNMGACYPPAPNEPGENTDKVRNGQPEQNTVTVQLDCNFYTNATSGSIVRRGLIAREENNDNNPQETYMKDSALRQTYSFYGREKEKQNRNPWQIDINDDHFKGCLSANRRRKRATTTTSVSFKVGEDSGCTGNTKPCNGPLHDNKAYSFRAFMCTNGGCTLTKYSPNIKTHKNMTPTIAGAVSGVIILLVIVVIVVVLLKRRGFSFPSSIGKPKPTTKAAEQTPQDGNIYDNVGFEMPEPEEPEPVPLDRFPEHVRNHHKDSDLLFAEEYKMVKENCGKYPWGQAELCDNKNKNRYINILPYDHSRVKLLPTDDEDGSDYINANYMPGYNSRREFIAAQGPLPGTVEDFWRMIWEQNVSMIVMVTQCSEKGKVKCEQYWPRDDEPHFIGDLQVTLRSESVLNTYTIRILDVKLKQGAISRTIKQMHFTRWPDFGCPENTELLLDFVNSVRSHMAHTSTGPTVVHCSAGVGRTGTYIAVDRLLQHIREHETIDIYHLVLEMREHRCNMVQTEDQYIYIHDCMSNAIEWGWHKKGQTNFMNGSAEDPV